MQILIIQLRQLGDILLTSTLAKVIKENMPSSTVHFLTSRQGKNLLECNPYIDRIITINNNPITEFKTILSIRKSAYTAVIDVQRTGRSKRITMLSRAKFKIGFKKNNDNFYYNVLIEHTTHGYTCKDRMELLKGIGIKKSVKSYLPEVFVSCHDIKTAINIMKSLQLKSRKFFVTVPTARRHQKAWELEKFAKLSKLLKSSTGLTPLIAYGPREKNMVQAIFKGNDYTVLPNPLPPRVFASLVKESAFFIGNNSFASHVAVAMKVKTFVVSGPESGWFPEFAGHVHELRKGLKCQPCSNWKDCKFNWECLRTFSTEEVFNKILKLIQ